MQDSGQSPQLPASGPLLPPLPLDLHQGVIVVLCWDRSTPSPVPTLTDISALGGCCFHILQSTWTQWTLLLIISLEGLHLRMCGFHLVAWTPAKSAQYAKKKILLLFCPWAFASFLLPIFSLNPHSCPPYRISCQTMLLVILHICISLASSLAHSLWGALGTSVISLVPCTTTLSFTLVIPSNSLTMTLMRSCSSLLPEWVPITSVLGFCNTIQINLMIPLSLGTDGIRG